MHYFPYDVKLGILAHSRSFLANQKARNAIFGAENLLIVDIPVPIHNNSARTLVWRFDDNVTPSAEQFASMSFTCSQVVPNRSWFKLQEAMPGNLKKNAKCRVPV